MTATGWAGFLWHHLTTVEDALLELCLEQAYDDSLVALALDAVDTSTCVIVDDWSGLSTRLQNPSVEPEHLIVRLLEHASNLRAAMKAGGGPRYSITHLRQKLGEAFPAPLPFTIRSQPFPRLWPRIADAIATMAVNTAKPGAPLWMTHALLSLSGYVQLCVEAIPNVTAKRINHLAKRSILGFQSTATRMPHEIRDGHIADSILAPQAPRRVQVQHHSRLLLEIDSALGRVRAGGGPLSILLEPNAAVPQHARIYARMFPAIRRATYRQYDNLIFLLLLFSGIEHVLRSRMQRLGKSHIRADGRPIPVLNWCASTLGLPPVLEDAIRQIYDPTATNLRNRLFHGGYHMVEHCRPRIVDQVFASGRYVPEVHSPEVAVEHAAWVLGELTNLWTRSDLDFGWIDPNPLGLADEAILVSLTSELDTPEVLEHQEQLRLYADNVAPTLTTLLKLGTIETVKNPSLMQLAAQYAIFEGLLRSTMQLIGIPTLDVTPHAKGAFVHTRMMDDGGLLSPAAVDSVLAPLSPSDRATALATLHTIVKFRNKLAHGNFVGIAAATKQLIGKTVFKLCLLMASAGLRHMIGERAYFRSTNRAGSSVEHWLHAESETFAALRARLSQTPGEALR